MFNSFLSFSDVMWVEHTTLNTNCSGNNLFILFHVPLRIKNVNSCQLRQQIVLILQMLCSRVEIYSCQLFYMLFDLMFLSRQKELGSRMIGKDSCLITYFPEHFDFDHLPHHNLKAWQQKNIKIKQWFLRSANLHLTHNFKLWTDRVLPFSSRFLASVWTFSLTSFRSFHMFWTRVSKPA